MTTTTRNGLECRACGCPTLHVVDSRRAINAVRRRRKCQCGARVTTFEFMSPADKDESARLAAALGLYDKILTLPDAQREALVAMMHALAPDPPPEIAPPLEPPLLMLMAPPKTTATLEDAKAGAP